jgi:hypothetical protein
MKKLCVYLSLFLTFGCVSIRSNVGAVPNFSKILVILKMNRADDEYASKYLLLFPKKYEVCAIAHDTISIVSLKDKTERWLNQCKSEVILTITTQKVGYNTGTVYGGHYVPQNLPYEIFAEMRLASDNKPFWKAQIGTAAIVGETFDPKRVISQLKRDKVVTRTSFSFRQRGLAARLLCCFWPIFHGKLGQRFLSIVF